jgi:DNA-directed RNA polymerase alpha subunit
MVTDILVKKNQELQEENERLKYALKSLQKELDECRKALDIKKEVQARQKDTKIKYSSKEIVAMAELLRKDILDLPLTVRTKNILHMSDICTLGDIIRIRKTGLMGVPHCGPTVRNEIEQFIQDSGLNWDLNVDDFIELDAQKAVSTK